MKTVLISQIFKENEETLIIQGLQATENTLTAIADIIVQHDLVEISMEIMFKLEVYILKNGKRALTRVKKSSRSFVLLINVLSVKK